MNYTLLYDFNSQLNCGLICFNEHSILIDFKDLFSIINFDRNFIHYYPEDKDYPFYLRHHQKISYLEYLFKFDFSNIEYVFKNNNKFDLRRENIIIYHNFHKKISEKYNILDFKLGHYIDTGSDAYIMKNPMWKIIENGKEYLLMYCEKNTIIKLCQESLDKIIEYEKDNNMNKITFLKLQNGYIMGSNNLYIHQIITGCYGNGKGTTNVSVDHIDQDPLNNTWENLRIATRKEQEQNSKGIKPGTKRERKLTAQNLPDGITQDMLKKYVVYYKDYADKDKKILREYFRVEKHPKLDKLWSTTKSNKITIQEKLAQANKVVDDLENNIYPKKEEIQLPKYVSLINTRGKEHLVFDKIHSDDRLNLKMVLPEEYDINEQIMLLKIKVKQKYGAYFIGNENIFNYSYLTEIDDKNKYVKKITFDIFRCFCHKKHTIEFENEKTERDAILEAEKWFSKNITEEYFNKYINYCDIEEQKKHYINYGVYCNCNRENYDEYKNFNKGQLLGGGTFLDTIEKFSYNHIYLVCGS
jgi:hypothetical protein